MKKPTVIFLHGGPGFSDYLKGFFGQDDRINSVFYTQKQGSGVNTVDLVEELDNIVESQNQAPWLLGHSWGGVLAIEYAKSYQDKISGISLLSTALGHKQWTSYKGDLIKKGLEDASPKEIFLTKREQAVGVPFLEEIWEGFCDKAFLSISENYLSHFNLLKDLGSIKKTILNFYGEKDLRFSPEIARTFKNHNKNIIDFELPESGHFPFLTRKNRELILDEILKMSLIEMV